MTGPWSAADLEARVEARILRLTSAPHDPVLIDVNAQRVFHGGQSVHLKRAEVSVLACLVKARPRALSSRETRLRALCSHGDGGTVRSHVCAINKGLKEIHVELLERVPGAGYRVVDGAEVVLVEAPSSSPEGRHGTR